MKCPACQSPLHVGFELSRNEFISWCGFGPCPSEKANKGEYGKTEEQAQLNLIKKLESNPDWSDERPEEDDAAELDAADHKNQMEKDNDHR